MNKKKIIILTSSGGAGHISATQAIQGYLQDEYDIKPVYALAEIFNSVDLISILSFKKTSSEKLYNYFLRKKWYWAINCMYAIGKPYSRFRKKRMIQLATEYLAKHKPDLIISVAPLINGAFLEAAKALDLPFMIIPTDLDADSFLQGIYNPDYDNFCMTVAFDDPIIKNTMKAARIKENQQHAVGFPLRKDFLQQHDTHTVKHKYNVPEGKPVVLMMMGGQGSAALTAFAKQIAQVNDELHLIACVGRDESAKAALEAISFNKNISTTFLCYTQDIAELMAISDIIITKSGSVSFVEAIYTNSPMILDATATPPKWEQLNHTLLKSLLNFSKINRGMIKLPII
jgi:processive 1,2-diacylglycerol beta-glucosyltransferase